jgi:hypothetical protein
MKTKMKRNFVNFLSENGFFKNIQNRTLISCKDVYETLKIYTNDLDTNEFLGPQIRIRNFKV